MADTDNIEEAKTTAHVHDHEHAEEKPMGCGILGQYPVLSVLVFATIGIGMGVGLSYWEPDDPEDKKITLRWLGLIGDMFIRALRAVVLPLVFINVVISVIEMMSLGRASSIGWLTIGTYFVTTLLAATLGVISIVSFKGLFSEGEFKPSSPPMVSLGCNAPGFFLTEMDDGGVMCAASTTGNVDSRFFITDITSSFVRRTSGARNDISLSDTFYDGIFTKLITDNIFADFVSANFASVVFFAIVFGCALGRILMRSGVNNFETSPIVQLFREFDAVFLILINWIIMLTPFAVWSLVVRAIGNQSNLKNAFQNVGYLAVATILAMAAHFFLVHVGLLTFICRKNPIPYLRHLIPAQTMAFACASSAATIPMTLRCVKNSGQVPDAVAKFVIPLGATVNMDGGAIYFPCACIWLAILNGITPDAASYLLLIIIATVGSAGTAPVPSASLVLIITAYNTVFNATGTPNGFEFILAIDWFMDRLRTTLNVTGDAIVGALVAGLTNYDEADETSSDNVTANGISASNKHIDDSSNDD